eukprot:1996545-Lingulodinium_polyedra.AAC.1
MSPKGAKQQLDAKLEEFRRQHEGAKEPNMEAVKAFFTGNELKALWGRLSTELAKQDLTVREAWDALVPANPDLGKAKPEHVKKDTLAAFVAFREGWQTRLVRCVESLKKTHKKSSLAEALTRGQLNQQHGEEEANDLISRG